MIIKMQGRINGLLFSMIHSIEYSSIVLCRIRPKSLIRKKSIGKLFHYWKPFYNNIKFQNFNTYLNKCFLYNNKETIVTISF